MILDNTEGEALAQDFWPVVSHGSALATSRRCIVAFEVATHGVEIQQFSDEEGGRILCRRTLRMKSIQRRNYQKKSEASR